MKVCDDMKNLSNEKIKEMHEKNKEVTRNNMRIALTSVEAFFNEVVKEANDSRINDIQCISNKKSSLVDPLYMQNIIIYVASMLSGSMIDNLELKLIMHCKVKAVDISYNPGYIDHLIITFEYPNYNEVESDEIAVPCRVKKDYIYF